MRPVLIRGFEFLSFFFAILSLELLSILYIPVVNSDLGLWRLVVKQHSVALRKMRLTLTCSD